MPKKAVALVSGGIDSIVALHEARPQRKIIAALSFDYGSKHNHKEIPCAVLHCKKLGIPHQVIALDFISRLLQSSLLKSGGPIPDGHYQEPAMQQTVVPFRNGIMLSIAGGYAESIGAQAVIIAAHAGDHAIYPDCRETFMKSMAAALKQGTYTGVEIIRPFIHFTKAEIVARGRKLGVDLSRTWSCYKGGDIHCGACGTCIERREAFQQAGVPDPTPYASLAPLPPKPQPVGGN
jgi:7-cyano-7-deazaguanine synthase